MSRPLTHARTKNVLVIYYSNSGDVKAVLESLIEPIQAAGFQVTWQVLSPVPPYPFPWPPREFFQVFPDVLGRDPPPLAPLEFDPEIDFDLVIIGWQVWFLRPSAPIQAFFRSPHARVLRNRRVVTVSCSRQMWRGAHQRLAKAIGDCGGHPTDNIAVTHQGGFSTFITTPHRLTTGKKEGLAFLPASGLDPASVAKYSEMGRRIRDASERWRDTASGALLHGLDTARYAENYALAEKVGDAYMSAWSCVAHRVGSWGTTSRSAAAGAFGLVLLLLIPIVVPITLLLTLIAKGCSALLARMRPQA
jgi:hypothetical protein